MREYKRPKLIKHIRYLKNIYTFWILRCKNYLNYYLSEAFLMIQNKSIK